MGSEMCIRDRVDSLDMLDAPFLPLRVASWAERLATLDDATRPLSRCQHSASGVRIHTQAGPREAPPDCGSVPALNRLRGVNFDSMMPRDPFADDPNDPASFIEDDEVVEPLSPEEREAVVQDLAQTREFKYVLQPRGILGIYFLCDDCEEVHYYDWDIMITNMVASL